MIWRCGSRTFDFSRRPLVMGVLNVTPDSFSDGGRYAEPQAAVARALELECQGADIIDVGGESSRPGAEPVPVEEELRRVIPVLEGLRGKLRIAISIDTVKAEVARAALRAGAEIINDITALMGDPEMAGVAGASDCGVILMHMQGTPQTMQIAPKYENVVGEVKEFLAARIAWAESAGIARERIAIDPGFGFGKSVEHNLELMQGLPRLVEIGRPVVVGISRKKFLRRIVEQRLGAEPRADSAEVREEMSRQLARAIQSGTAVIRVHDVEAAPASVVRV